MVQFLDLRIVVGSISLFFGGSHQEDYLNKQVTTLSSRLINRSLVPIGTGIQEGYAWFPEKNRLMGIFASF